MTKPLLPSTRATAQPAGWSWQIPLQNRMGQGYVYSSRFCSDAAAKSTLMRSLGGSPLEDPRIIPFTTGHRRELWKHNCLSIGLASGFVEPLEATSIHMIARGMDFFLRYFPDCDCDPALIREYNRRMVADYENSVFVSFTAQHAGRFAFRQWCKTSKLPIHEGTDQAVKNLRCAARRNRWVVSGLQLAIHVRRRGHQSSSLPARGSLDCGNRGLIGHAEAAIAGMVAPPTTKIPAKRRSAERIEPTACVAKIYQVPVFIGLLPMMLRLRGSACG